MKYAIVTGKGETSREIFLKANRFVIERKIKEAKDTLLKMGYKNIEIDYLTKISLSIQEFNKRIEEIESAVHTYPPTPTVNKQ